MNEKRSYKGQRHLIYGFVGVVLVQLAVLALMLVNMHNIHQDISRTLTDQNEKALQVGIMRDAMRKRQVGLRDMVILDDPFERDAAWQSYNASATEFITARQRLRDIGLTAPEQASLERLSGRASDAYVTQQNVIDMVNGEARSEQIEQLLHKAIRSQNAATAEMTELIEMQRSAATTTVIESRRNFQNTLYFLVLISSAALALTAAIAILALRRDRALLDDLDNYRIHLQELVRQRTEELETSVTELKNFSYALAHDLRQPLRGMDGFSHILLDDYADRLDDDARNYLQRIRAGSQHMGQLIDGMLKLANLSQQPLYPVMIDLSQLCGEIVEQLHQDEPERDIDFRIEPGIRVIGDENLLRIAMENLLSNSWKFTRHRSPARIRIGRRSGDGEAVCFVRDNGAGFDMTYVHKLFRTFERLHSTEEFEGTGIGLATVARIIERHAGRIWAESRPDAGATFYFCLPPCASASQVRVGTQPNQPAFTGPGYAGTMK
jgi:signal transduction histidine kinase